MRNDRMLTLLCGAALLTLLPGCGGGGGAPSAAYTAAFKEFAVPVPGTDPGVTPAGSWPDDVAVDSRGFVWFPEHYADEIGTMSPAGVYRGYRVPTGSGLMDGIVIDSSRGTVWVSETATNRLARIDTGSGAVTELPLQSANAVPGDLTLAPDGSIWFSEGYEGGAGKGRIAHLDPGTNSITELTPPNNPSGIDGILATRSGAIWFAENNENSIGSYISGQFLTFPLPRASVDPTNLAIDSRGRIWVTEQYGNAIASFDPSRHVWTEFTIPNRNGQPSGIAIDSHDNVWFTEFGPGKIGVLPAGSSAIVDFLIPTADSGPEDIAIGANGAIYFTEQNTNKIGQISVPGLTVQ